ncbi:GNAT family N-acetyltransferase [Paenibacillus wynnii]|uniref:GNAT family N-acetyltransferase n=1 Tax=Paenibacillus wynnii TaxID=268407 RepID=UPI000689B2FA|nr:GNAT family N-acetyltransferase [Paenibacillus wynnii]
MSTYEAIQFHRQNGTAVELKPMLQEDAGTLRSLLSQPELRTHIVMRGDGLQNASMEKLMNRMLLAYDPCALHAGIYRSGDSELIGTVSLQCWNRRNGSAILGYLLDPVWWGRGFATEAVRLLLNYSFYELGITEVEGRCRESNSRSARVMLKNGMLLERVIPNVGSERDCINVFRLLHK